MTDTFTATVIPAKAGIQLIIKSPRSGQSRVWGVATLRGSVVNCLDSGLRRNDELMYFVYRCTRFNVAFNYLKLNNLCNLWIKIFYSD